MTLILIAGLAAISGLIGLLLGAAIGAGARADKDFEEYQNKENGR